MSENLNKDYVFSLLKITNEDPFSNIFYYRGLNQYQSNKEKSYLIDTCLNAQDQYKVVIERFLKI